jgi:hypothetical protein
MTVIDPLQPLIFCRKGREVTRKAIATVSIVLASFFSASVWAQDSNPAASINRITAPLFIAAGIAYVTRRMAIGGWLFYFYLILIMQVAFLGFTLWLEIEATSMEGWDPFYYWLSWADFLSYAIAKIVCLIFAIRFWSEAQRTLENLKYMRIILGIVLATAIGRIAMNSMVWLEQDSTILLFIPLFSAVLWFTYWLVSRRVKYIFDLQGESFDYDEFKGRLKQPKDDLAS